MKHKQLAVSLAVASALSIGVIACSGSAWGAETLNANPENAAASSNSSINSQVTNTVRGMMSAAERANAASSADSKRNSAAARSAQSGQGKDSASASSASEEYPSVPAEYLRPNADPAGKAKAVEKLAETVRKGDQKAAAEAQAESRRKPAASVGQVHINTEGVIAMKPGENVFIPISREHPNRLLTPFKNPQIVSTSLFAGKKKGDCGEVCVRDGVIYVTTDAPSAVTAFITEKGHEDIAFSVTMVPQAIPPREVRFTLPPDVVEKLSARKASDIGIRKAQAWEQSQPYVETIRKALRGVALGQVPSGYNMRKLRVSDAVPTCRHLGLDFDWSNGQILEGYNLDIYVGVLKNIADSPVEFRNQNCGGWRTAAVTSWPLSVLEPGQKTEIYVVVRHEDEIPNDQIRKPLIPREYN